MDFYLKLSKPSPFFLDTVSGRTKLPNRKTFSNLIFFGCWSVNDYCTICFITQGVSQLFLFNPHSEKETLNQLRFFFIIEEANDAFIGV